MTAHGRAQRVHARGRYVGALTCMTLVGSLASCSSGANSSTVVTEPKVTTSTSPTSVPNPQTVVAFLAGPAGKMLLAYEQATDHFVAGSRPNRPDCQHFLSDVFPTIARSSDDLFRAVGSVPDAPLGAALRQDVANRVLLLGACVSPTGLLANHDMDRTYLLYRDHARATAQLLTRLGVNP